MRIRKQTALFALLAAAAMVVVLVVALSLVSWNFAKPWIGDRISRATDRPFAINGDLTLDWDRPAELQSGWRRLVPWPHFRARDVVLGNPDWAQTGPHMLRAERIDFTLNPLALFRRTVEVPSLILSQSALVLEMDEEGRTNWSFPHKEDASSWKLDLRNLAVTDANVRFINPAREADVRVHLHTLDNHSVSWTVSGKIGGDPVSGKGKAGALLALSESGTAYPLEADLTVGKSELSAEGTVTDPRQLSALDLNLKIEGASMAQLFPMTGLALPATPRFSTAGRLVGSVQPDDFHLRYEKFSGKVGASDLAGTLEYARKDGRASLRGEVVSEHLELDDLQALLGTDSAEARKKRGDTSRQPPDKLLPVGEFRTERWQHLDAQVQFRAKQVVRPEGLPIDSLHAGIQLKDGVLEFDPLDFGMAGGKLAGQLLVDGRHDPAQARLVISARNLRLNRLFPKVDEMKASVGALHVNAEVTGAGNSFAALAGAADGELRAFVSEGTISKFVLEAMGLNIGSMIVTQLFGDHQVRLHCLASDFEIKDGLMRTRTFVVDTSDAIIGVAGRINLDQERLNLTIYPESKGLRVLSLRAPLHVRGTFKNPDLAVDKMAAAKAGIAAALGIVATPLAALLALVNPGPDQESPCPELLARAKEAPQAPPANAKQ